MPRDPKLKLKIYWQLPSPIATSDDCRRVAAELKCSQSVVSHYASIYGRLQPPTRLLPPLVEIRELIEAGIRPVDISRASGVSRPALYRALGRAGFKLRRGQIIPKAEAA